jgi:hypothetical protein
MLLNVRSITAVLAVASLLFAASGFAQQDRIAATHLRGRVVDNVTGVGIGKVEVKLLDAEGIMMDISETDGSGSYKLDLGVMDNKTYTNLRTFFVEANDKNGHIKRQGLSNGLRKEARKVYSPDITLP